MWSAVRLSILISFQHPGVLGAAALRGIDHQRPLAQRHPREPPWNDTYITTRQHEWTQVDVARREAQICKRRTCRQRQGRLRDVAVGSCDDLLTKMLDFGLGRGRTDEHAVAAGAVDLFDDEFGQ